MKRKHVCRGFRIYRIFYERGTQNVLKCLNALKFQIHNISDKDIFFFILFSTIRVG